MGTRPRPPTIEGSSGAAGERLGDTPGEGDRVAGAVAVLHAGKVEQGPGGLCQVAARSSTGGELDDERVARIDLQHRRASADAAAGPAQQALELQVRPLGRGGEDHGAVDQAVKPRRSKMF